MCAAGSPPIFETAPDRSARHSAARKSPSPSRSADYILLAKFDLLAVEPGGRALILDWKTGAHIPPRRMSCQSGCKPSSIAMCWRRVAAYLNGGQPIPPEQHRDGLLVCRTRRRDSPLSLRRRPIRRRRSLLSCASSTKSTPAPDFPLTPDVTRCRFCVYRSLCDRGTSAGSLSEWESDDFEPADMDDFTLDFDQIAEIEF